MTYRASFTAYFVTPGREYDPATYLVVSFLLSILGKEQITPHYCIFLAFKITAYQMSQPDFNVSLIYSLDHVIIISAASYTRTGELGETLS